MIMGMKAIDFYTSIEDTIAYILVSYWIHWK